MPGAASFKRVLDGELFLDGVARRARFWRPSLPAFEGVFRSPHGRTVVRVRARYVAHGVVGRGELGLHQRVRTRGAPWR